MKKAAYKEIPVGLDTVALVDAADYEWLSGWRWHRNAGRYAATYNPSTKKREYMHRMIMKPAPGLEVDHINGNPLDNRRANLRICTHHENTQNVARRRGGTSQYRGVCFSREMKKWVVHITYNYQTKHVGYFETETEAAHAYDRAARSTFGVYARLNRPEFMEAFEYVAHRAGLRAAKYNDMFRAGDDLVEVFTSRADAVICLDGLQ